MSVLIEAGARGSVAQVAQAQVAQVQSSLVQGAQVQGAHVQPGRVDRRTLVRLLGEEAGMTTAEYAVGTVAACGMGGVLIKLLSSPQVTEMLWKVFEKAFSFIF